MRVGVTLAIVVLTAFAGAFGMHRYHDDWVSASMMLESMQTSNPWTLMFQDMGLHWSPLWTAFRIVNLNITGVESDVLIRGLTVVLAIGTLLVFVRLARAWSLGPTATTAGLATLGLHHLNAVSYYSFDCYSQLAADLCSWAALGLALTAAHASDRLQARRQLTAALVVFVVGILTKEQALTTIAGLAVIATWHSTVSPVSAERQRTLWLATLAALACGVAFAFLRWRAGLWMEPGGPFSTCVTCVSDNIGMLVGAALLPINTIDVYVALQDLARAPALLALAGLLTAVVLALLVGGLSAWRQAHSDRRIGLIALLFLSSTFPVAILEHVGELHAHTLLFWFAMLVAHAVDGWLVRLSSPSSRLMVTGVSVLYVASLATGLRANLGEIRATGERARTWIARFDDALRAVPAGSVVVFRGLHDQKGETDYSLYRLTTPGVLLSGTIGLTMSIRPDLQMVDPEGDIGSTVKDLDPAGIRSVYVVDSVPAIRVTPWARSTTPQ